MRPPRSSVSVPTRSMFHAEPAGTMIGFKHCVAVNCMAHRTVVLSIRQSRVPGHTLTGGRGAAADVQLSRRRATGIPRARAARHRSDPTSSVLVTGMDKSTRATVGDEGAMPAYASDDTASVGHARLLVRRNAASSDFRE